MTVKTKRMAKKAAKNGVCALTDIFFMVVKAMGTVVMIAATTLVLFLCLALIYVRTNLTSELDVNYTDFTLNLSSVIYCIDPETGLEKELVTLQSSEYRRYVEYEQIPEHLINALVAVEDHRFFEHQGVDWYRTAGAFVNMFARMRDTFGGSTITQQLIKNYTQEDDVTVQRKLLEVFRALEYERQYSKEEILEKYLNLVYFGHGCYGIGAAAHYYFNKEVSDLTLAESAAIVGITNNPSMYSPYANKEANKERQELILSLMKKHGYLNSDQDLERAVKARLNFQRGEDEEYEQTIYTWFEEAVIRDVIRDIQLQNGVSSQIARRLLYTGGLRILATIDTKMQEIVDNIYEHPDSLPKVTGSAQQLQSGIVIADPYTGEIKALSGGVGNKTRNMLLSRATSTYRPPGSALKPISVYAPAMDNGLITPTTRFEDSADVVLNGTTWMPKNADRKYAGIVDLRTAIRLSLNTTPAIVLDQLSVPVAYRFLKDALGFNLRPEDEDYAPLAAGQLTRGATVSEMVSGFTMFPNMGQRVELRTYTIIKDSNGNVFLDNQPKYTRVISETTAYWMTDLLYEAATRGTGTAANLGRTMRTAGKTGTSSDSKDRWFVGFTPYYIAAVWTGYDTPAVMKSSSNPSAQIWKMIMAPIHEDLENREFKMPEDPSVINSQRPVQGIDTADYTVRCVDVWGELLKEESKSAIVSRTVTINAPDVEGYALISEPSVTITVISDPAMNVVTFLYQAREPEVTEEPDDKEDTGEPGDPGGEPDPWDPSDPGNTGEPGNTDDQNAPGTSPPTTEEPFIPPPDPGDVPGYGDG